MKKVVIPVVIAVLLIGGGALYWFVFRKDLSNQVVLPYISHQKPRVDPHVPSSVTVADKLDEAVFDGLFNVAASPSGIVYEDGLGEFMGIDENSVVSVRLNPSKKWHSSYAVAMDKDEVTITPAQEVSWAAKDLRFTLRRIQRLGSLSPDYILVSQAVADFDFVGPDENNEIRFQFRPDRMWTEGDIKEVLSFKVLPATASMDAPAYTEGTGPYLKAGEYEDKILFRNTPDGPAQIGNLILNPYIDNSTYTTELKNRNINALLSTPFGAKSPILSDSTKYFHKSSIATTFFALFHNTRRLNREQRSALRSLVNNEILVDRFFRIGTPQQRHIADYRSAGDNYEDYLNFSVFPTTSYYVEEQIVMPLMQHPPTDFDVLPDTVRIQTCLNYGFREELSELVSILNDPAVFHGKVKVTAVSNEEIGRGNYDAVLVPISGYRSNFLFDLYNIFLREPDFASYRVNLQTQVNRGGEVVANPSSFQATNNFFGLDLSGSSAEHEDIATLLEYIHGFMATREVGDKQAYARMIDELDQEMALGTWLFSLPSLAYFDNQFEPASIDMYGTASQLSTIEKWQEKGK